MKTIALKIRESKNPGIKIQWLKELDNHTKFCKTSNFIIDESEIFCDKCYRNLLKICSFCGSNKIEESKFNYKCSFCKSIIDKRFVFS